MLGLNTRILSSNPLLKICSAAVLVSALGIAETAVFPRANAAYAQATAVFSRIDVAGNQRIAGDTIRTFAGIEPGKRVTPGEINDAVQRLYASGLFENVEIRPEGGRLVIEVLESATINVVTIEGNRRLKDKVLEPLIGARPRHAFSAAQAEADVRAITEAYRAAGRYETEVTPKIIRRSDNRVDLIYEVKEGRVTEIGRVSFVGNRVYSDRRLRRVLASKQAGPLRFLVKSDTYVQERIAFDEQKLREFYLHRGYIDFAVLSSAADLTRERNSFLVTFNIQEGQQFRFGDLTITSLEDDINPDDFQKTLKIKSGSIYNPEDVELVLKRLDYMAATRGLPFVQATPRVTRNNADRTIDIEFELARGERIFIERIDIEGNTTTLDRVIRREFNVVEGDPFNRREVIAASERIQKLGYFANSSVESREGSAPDQAVIDVNVEDQPTGSLSFGLSYSSADGPSGTVAITEKNFLGRGQTFNLSFSTARENRNLSLGLREPSLFDRDLSGNVNLYYYTGTHSETNTFAYRQFDVSTLGLGLGVEFPVSENGRLGLSYRLSQDEIKNYTGQSPYIQLDVDKGKSLTSSVTANYVFDKTDSPISPTSGFVFRLNQELAGLGGEQQFSKTVVSAKAYKSFFNEELVFSAEIEGGFLKNFGSGSRSIDRFYLGGDSFRGFEDGGIGPRAVNLGVVTTPDDPATPADESVMSDFSEALGGNAFAIARLEASFPLGLPEEYGIYGGFFADAGYLWKLDDYSGDSSAKLRAAVGFSIFWETGIGPLRFNFAKPLIHETYDRTESFRFTIDTRF